MKKALFIDFEDSFSFNVVQKLTESGLTVDVLSWTDFQEITDHDLLVLGPGPGHPDDYQSLYPLIQSWIDGGKRIFAVCLGHQILWRMRGGEVIRSSRPLHGQSVLINLSPSWQHWLELPQTIQVQRYNSLAVKDAPQLEGIENLVHEGEIVITKLKNVISYQFHPESVGTKCPASFFRPILRDLL